MTLFDGDELLQNIDQVEAPPKEVPQTTKDALLGLGRTVLMAIDSVIAMAITQYAQQLANLTSSQLTNSGALADLRVFADNIIKPVEEFKKTTLSYLDKNDVLKYLELFPEIRQPVQEAIDIIFDVASQVESIAEDIKRMTYANDLVNGIMNNASGAITELVQLRNLIGQLLE